MSPRIVSAVRISRSLLSLVSQRYLFPFVVSQALPWAFGYYGNSVALRVSLLGDPAFTLVERLVCLGFPFASFFLFITGRLPERAFALGESFLARSGIVASGMLRRVGRVPLETRIKPV